MIMGITAGRSGRRRRAEAAFRVGPAGSWTCSKSIGDIGGGSRSARDRVVAVGEPVQIVIDKSRDRAAGIGLLCEVPVGVILREGYRTIV